MCRNNILVVIHCAPRERMTKNDSIFLQEEFDLIQKLHDEEKKDLAELETHFNKLAEKYDAIMEERRLAQEEAERREKELAIAIKGLTLLQAIWRGNKVRRTLKGNKVKGKKGAKKAKNKK